MHKYVWLHVESTTRCNAWCPFCERNNKGFGLSPNLVVQDLQIEKLQEVVETHTDLQTIQFCGNLGDPLAAKNFDSQLDLVLSYPKIKNIQIHTNGSLRNQQWWRNLAHKTKSVGLKVWFGIDGNQTNHSVYRQGTDYNRIIQNAKTFIDAGGDAIWQFILFEHNKNDMIECYKLSQQMKFIDFKVLKNHSNKDKSYHYQTGEELHIKSVSDSDNSLSSLQKNKDIVHSKDCMHVSYPSIYLAANGKISPCCYLYGSPINDADIHKSFSSARFYSTCLKYCGSQIDHDKSTNL